MPDTDIPESDKPDTDIPDTDTPDTDIRVGLHRMYYIQLTYNTGGDHVILVKHTHK